METRPVEWPAMTANRHLASTLLLTYRRAFTKPRLHFLSLRARRFFDGPKRSTHVEEDAVREVQAVLAAAPAPARPGVAEPPDHQGATVVLGRPARRQPGPHRPDGPGPQAAPFRGPRGH